MNKKVKKVITGILNKIIMCVLVVVIVLAGVISILEIKQQERNFLKNLEISDVKSIRIDSGWGQAELSESEIIDLVNQLNNVVLIGKRKFDLSEWSGMSSLMFHITLTNNKAFDFSASNPLYIIDAKTGYEADYLICEELSQTYYSLVEKYFPRN